MNLLESLQMAGKTLVANKLRSTLTMLGIIIGNASVIAMIGVGEGAQKFVAKELIPNRQDLNIFSNRVKPFNISYFKTIWYNKSFTGYKYWIKLVLL